MIGFQYRNNNFTFYYRNIEYQLSNYNQYRILYIFLKNYIICKKISLEFLKIIFLSSFQCIFLYRNETIYKLSFDQLTNLYEQYNVSVDNTYLGRTFSILPIYNIGYIVESEYIPYMLGFNIFLKLEGEPFIVFYSLTLDYLKAILFLHKKGYLHSSLKPIQYMVDNLGRGKIVGLENIIAIEANKTFYENTGGSVKYLAPERYRYFLQNGFFGMTSKASDTWELIYSILCSLDIINQDEFIDILKNNQDLLESYLLNHIINKFGLSWGSDIFGFVHNYCYVISKGLQYDIDQRWYIDKIILHLLGYKKS